jgi:predicted SAM-dependent methyltransferase
MEEIPLTCDGRWSVTPDQLEFLSETQGMKSDGQGGTHLLERRRAQAKVIEYCKGIGLDIGCRNNKITPSTIGIDLIDGDGCPWGPNIVGDGTNLKIFSSNSLDYVFAGHMLEDIWDPIGCLREWIRVVKPGGYVILITPHASYYPRVGTHGANPDHKFDYWPNHMANMVTHCFGDMIKVIQLDTIQNQFEFDLVMQINKKQLIRS